MMTAALSATTISAVTTVETLVIFDGRLPDLEILYKGLAEGAIGYTIPAEVDALPLITKWLALTGATRLAIVAHGEPGLVHLGVQAWDGAYLRQQAGLLQEWGVTEIALYCCEVGADEEFVQLLGGLTGAKVLAARGSVGPVALGGSWDLGLSMNNIWLAGQLESCTTLLGTPGDDVLQGNLGNGINDSIDGGAGNDRLLIDYIGNNSVVMSYSTSTGNGFIKAGLETDTFSSIESFSIYSGSGNDSLLGGTGNDSIDGGIGNDTLNAGNGNNTLSGRDGNDRITSGTGDDSIDGGNGNDQLSAGNGNNTLSGGDGNDNLTSGTGNDSIDGGNGNDQLSAGNGNNTLSGGDGNDNLTSGTGNDSIDGGNGNDRLQSSYSNAVLMSYDTLNGSGSITSGSEIDTFISIESFNITAGNGNDFLLGSTGDDYLHGGDGNNTVSGGDGHDDLTSGTGNDSIDGGNGNDTLRAGDGDNTLSGGNGNDNFTSGTGNDSIDGGNGNDILNALYSNAVLMSYDTLNGSGFITSGSEIDSFIGIESFNITTGNGNNSLIGGTGNDRLNTGAGNNTLSGGDGDDDLTSGDGNDSIDGGTGDDRLNARGGNNTLSGGDGNDVI
jgi:Ca2+-binding RTX toxin-like protein